MFESMYVNKNVRVIRRWYDSEDAPHHYYLTFMLNIILLHYFSVHTHKAIKNKKKNLYFHMCEENYNLTDFIAHNIYKWICVGEQCGMLPKSVTCKIQI